MHIMDTYLFEEASFINMSFNGSSHLETLQELFEILLGIHISAYPLNI